MSSKSERITFSGREDGFVCFAEQFEARVHSLKLGRATTGDATHEKYMPTVRNGASEEQRAQVVNKGRKKSK